MFYNGAHQAIVDADNSVGMGWNEHSMLMFATQFISDTGLAVEFKKYMECVAQECVDELDRENERV